MPLRVSFFYCNHFPSVFVTLIVLHYAGACEPDWQLATNIWKDYVKREVGQVISIAQSK